MIEGIQEYTWGVVMLGQIYHDMHLCLYWDYRNLGIGVTLLHISEWEHIAVTYLIGRQEMR